MLKRYWKFRLIQMHFSNPSAFTPFWRDKAGFGFNSKARNRASGLTRSRPLARPSRAFGFAQILFAISQMLKSITDGEYAAMMNAIRQDETPNFYFMQYELAAWRVGGIGRDDLIA